MNAKHFTVGQQVINKHQRDMSGKIAAGPFDIKCQTQYVIELDRGAAFWNPDKTCWVTHLVIHEDHLEAMRPLADWRRLYTGTDVNA